jgi:hypothetical protein
MTFYWFLFVLVLRFFINSSLSLRFLVQKFVHCIGSCHLPASITISPGLAISVANLIDSCLSGITNKFFSLLFVISISFVSCLMIESLFSVFGSSSVAIAISEYSRQILPISGLFVLSLLPGAQKTRINLPFPFKVLKNCNVFSKASGECAKSTKYVTQLCMIFSILPLTPVKLDNDEIHLFTSNHIWIQTLRAVK